MHAPHEQGRTVMRPCFRGLLHRYLAAVLDVNAALDWFSIEFAAAEVVPDLRQTGLVRAVNGQDSCGGFFIVEVQFEGADGCQTGIRRPPTVRPSSRK